MLVLTIGPGIPTEFIEGHPLWEHGWVKLWLAIDKHYLPLRTEIYMKVPENRNAAFYTARGVNVLTAADAEGRSSEYYRLLCDVDEIRDVTDHARNEPLPFPWHITLVSGGTLDTRCERVDVNVSLAAAEFTASIPTDYTITNDREVVRARLGPSRVDGDETLVSVGNAGRQARELLGAAIPRQWILRHRCAGSGSRSQGVVLL